VTIFSLIPVQPIGTSPSRTFVDGVDAAGKRFGRVQEMRMPEYPPSPQGMILRAVRLDEGIILREAARRCGLSAVEYSGLENGKFQLSDEDWKRVTKFVLGVQ
jgi:Helix-turn-helix